MFSFKPSEVAQIGMGIEKNGMAFYNALADRVKDGEAKSIFSYLAKEEQTHYETFEKLSDKFSSYEIPEGFGEEDENYLQQLVDNNVFTKDIDAKKLAREVETPLEAIELALGFEKDSVIFFLAFKKIVPEEEQFAIDKLIDEENNHIKALLQIKKDITETREEFFITKGDWDSERQ